MGTPESKELEMIEPSQFPLLSEVNQLPADEVERIRNLASTAHVFLSSHSWCTGVQDTRFGDGIGGVVGIFLVQPRYRDADSPAEWLWVVVGDLPSAYFVVEDTSGPADALSIYVQIMEDWAQWVLHGCDKADDVYPVRAEPTMEHARMLLSRTRYLADVVVPWMRESR